MRPRKVAAVSRAVALDEPAPTDLHDVFPLDDIPAEDAIPLSEESPAKERVCLECGGHGGSTRDGCAHLELVRFHAPSRAAQNAIARLRRAAAEHRAAVRALRALVTSECAQGRAEILEAAKPEPEPSAPSVSAPIPSTAPTAAPADPLPAPSMDPPPCPRCAALASVPEPPPLPAAPPPPTSPRSPRRKSRVPLEQQAFAFLDPLDPRAPSSQEAPSSAPSPADEQEARILPF